MSNGLGTNYIGPISVVESNVRASIQSYYNGIGENIKGGAFGAVGYLVGGDKGSYVGAAFDGLTFSFAGLSNESSVFPRAAIPSATPGTPIINKALNERQSVNLVLELKPNWNDQQVSEVYEKAHIISNNPNTKKVGNPSDGRPSNLRSKFVKNGGVVTSTQDVDHNTDLQLNGTNSMDNLSGRDKSVNRSLGPQIFNQIKNLPDGTKINKVFVNPFIRKR
jgi:hypothetical protein